MKKNIPLVFLMLFLSSCQEKKNAMVVSFPSLFVISKEGNDDVKVLDDDNVIPFNTSIMASLYCFENQYTSSQLSKMKKDYQEKIMYEHALFDRHSFYTYKGEKINNVKVINESYGKEEKIFLDDDLYDLLKRSFQFSLDSELRFNIFLGKINDLYEEKLSKKSDVEGKSPLDYALQESTNLYFMSFTDEEKSEISEYVSSLPKTKEETKSLLSFDDEEKSIIFHAKKDEEGNILPLEISLGGCAKGYAIEKISQDFLSEYPDICLLVNGGTSSIKATRKRIDDKDYLVRYINPTYQEVLSPDKNTYNDYEVQIAIDDAFNLSTSGYYENYFYEYEDGNFLLRNHILSSQSGYSTSYFDAVSVNLSDTFLADMYTTALMNTSSIKEAKEVFSSLNEIYNIQDAGLILSKKEEEDGSDFVRTIKNYSPLNEKSLPLFVDEKKKEYQGDYSSITFNELQKGSFQTKETKKHVQAYYFSENLYSKANLISSSKLKYPKNVISKIKEM